MDRLFTVAEIAGAITGVLALVCMIVPPVREKLFGLRDIKEGMKCQLRSDMLRTYYKHHESGKIRQYEYENFLASYLAYKALGGNSFIDKIYSEVKTWEVIT